MLVLGLILILLAAGAITAVVLSGTDDRAVLYGGDVHLPTLVVFLVGAATLLVLLLGLQLLRSGLLRASQNRKKSKRLRTLEQREQAQRERDGSATAGGAGPRPVESGTTPADREPGAGEPAPRTEGPYQTPPPPSR